MYFGFFVGLACTLSTSVLSLECILPVRFAVASGLVGIRSIRTLLMVEGYETNTSRD